MYTREKAELHEVTLNHDFLVYSRIHIASEKLMVAAKSGSLIAIQELGRRWSNDAEDALLGLESLFSIMKDTLAGLSITIEEIVAGEVLPELTADVSRMISAVLDIIHPLLSSPGKDLRVVKMLMVNLSVVIPFQRMCRTHRESLIVLTRFLESIKPRDCYPLWELCVDPCFAWITQPLSTNIIDSDDEIAYIVFLDTLVNHILLGRTAGRIIGETLPLIGKRMLTNFVHVLSFLNHAFLYSPLGSPDIPRYWLNGFIRFHAAAVAVLSTPKLQKYPYVLECNFFLFYLQVASMAWQRATSDESQVRVSVRLMEAFDLIITYHFPRREQPGNLLTEGLFIHLLVGLGNATDTAAEYIGKNLSPFAHLPSRRVARSLGAAIDNIPLSARTKLMNPTHPASHHWNVVRQLAATNLDIFDNPKSSDPVLCYCAKHIETAALETVRRGKRKFKVCSRCKVATYCSAQCQKADWAQLHRSECKRFAQARRDLENRNVWISHYIKRHSLIFVDAFIRLRDDPASIGRLFSPFTSTLQAKIRMKGARATTKNSIFLSYDEPGANRETVLTVAQYVEKYSKWPLWSQDRFDALLAMVKHRDAVLLAYDMGKAAYTHHLLLFFDMASPKSKQTLFLGMVLQNDGL
ncbi:hypothetical protein CC2G_004428 [Coprinopsis cinerea AmutBmut pab1-1]|nr:hypothetical protein CC2G_004428 [Coprinopsis cinerea AmutBmut pab1-1]